MNVMDGRFVVGRRLWRIHACRRSFAVLDRRETSSSPLFIGPSRTSHHDCQDLDPRRSATRQQLYSTRHSVNNCSSQRLELPPKQTESWKQGRYHGGIGTHAPNQRSGPPLPPTKFLLSVIGRLGWKFLWLCSYVLLYFIFLSITAD